MLSTSLLSLRINVLALISSLVPLYHTLHATERSRECESQINCIGSTTSWNKRVQTGRPVDPQSLQYNCEKVRATTPSDILH